MTKEEFVKKCDALREQKLQYEKEYIASNTKYAAGTKIKATHNGKERIGIVKYSVVEYDEVVPYALVITKEGEESKRRLRVYPEDEVEII